MDLGIRGKVAVVCGASSGMGRATAHRLAEAGARVALCARRADRLEEAAAAIRAAGGEALPVAADVTDEASIDRFLGEVVRSLGPVDILINNAGGPPAGNFQDTPPESYPVAHRLTLQSAVSFCRRVVPGMRDRGWGRIVTITSLTVKQPSDTLILSNTYRAGLTAFLKTLAGEVAPHGITVNCVCPGFTDTERLDELAAALAAKRGIKPEAIRGEWEKNIPAGRLGRPEEIADLIAFLASDRAGYITGTSILVDGGLVRALV